MVLDEECDVISVRLQRLSMLELHHDTVSYEKDGVLAYEGEKVSSRRFISAEQFEACPIEPSYFTNQSVTFQAIVIGILCSFHEGLGKYIRCGYSD